MLFVLRNNGNVTASNKGGQTNDQTYRQIKIQKIMINVCLFNVIGYGSRRK